MSESVAPPPAALQAALDWLAAPPAEEPLAELVAFCAHLAGATGAVPPVLQWHTIIEIFHGRAARIDAALKPLLLEAALPLPRRLRMVAQGLIEAHGALAAGYLRVLREGDPEKLLRPRRNQAVLSARAIGHLAEQQEIALLVAAPPPPNLWQQSLSILRLLREGFPPEATLPPDTVAADRILKRMLALAAAQPEACAGREIAFIADYLRGFSGAVEIQFSTPADGAEWHWLDEAGGHPPMALVRRQPPADSRPLFFSCQLLASAARNHLKRLTAGETPEALGLPAAAADENYRDTLARVADRWASPAKRRSHRRRSDSRVQVCARFDLLWGLLGGEPDPSNPPPIAEWMVLNESAGGFAIMHVAGDMEGIVAGTALGLRNGGEDWRLCLVRWLRSDNAEHVELGLELVSPGAQAVRAVFPAKRGEEPRPEPALLLPTLPSLERGETLMTEHGRYAGGNFTLITEADGKLKVTECLIEDLVVQTAAVDVFGFVRNFSPS